MTELAFDHLEAMTDPLARGFFQGYVWQVFGILQPEIYRNKSAKALSIDNADAPRPLSVADAEAKMHTRRVLTDRLQQVVKAASSKLGPQADDGNQLLAQECCDTAIVELAIHCDDLYAIEPRMIGLRNPFNDFSVQLLSSYQGNRSNPLPLGMCLPGLSKEL